MVRVSHSVVAFIPGDTVADATRNRLGYHRFVESRGHRVSNYVIFPNFRPIPVIIRDDVHQH